MRLLGRADVLLLHEDPVRRSVGRLEVDAIDGDHLLRRVALPHEVGVAAEVRKEEANG